MKNILLTIILILVMGLAQLNLVLAADTLGTFKLNQDVQLVQTCTNTTALCSSCTLISVRYPNGTAFITDTVMDERLYDFYYNITANLTIVSGTYNVDGLCTDGSLIENFAYTFEINPIGIQATGNRITATTIGIVAFFILTTLFFIAFIFFQHPAAKYSFLVVSAIFLVGAINLITNTLTNEVVDPTLIDLFDFIGGASYYFYWFGGGILCIILFLTVFTTIWDKVKAKRLEKYGGMQFG